jgi:hypothetical protein
LLLLAQLQLPLHEPEHPRPQLQLERTVLLTLPVATVPLLQTDCGGKSGRAKNSSQTLSANSSAGGIGQ